MKYEAKNMKHKKGFTLIELLVVIGIIGILSSIVLASLNTARAKGADATIKADLAGLRPQAEIYFDNNGDYGTDAGDCASGLFADPSMATAITHAQTVSGGGATCLSDDRDPLAGLATTWAISVPLKTNPLTSWCVDYTGMATTATATINVNDEALCQ